jgi:hypothetical protein
MNRLKTITLLTTAVMLLSAGAASADIITQPVGLNPGDEYHLAFVTSGTRDATSTDIADYGYPSFCWMARSWSMTTSICGT